MGKCLLIKLQGTIANQNLAKVDDFRIKFGEPPSISSNSQYVSISPIGIPFRVINGYLTDENLTENKGTSGKTVEAGMYFSKGSEVFFEGKSKVEIIYTHKSGEINNSAKEISLKDFKYSKLLRVLDFRKCKVNGNLSDLKNLINLTTIFGNDTELEGDVAELADLEKLMSVNLSYCTKIKGDLSKLPKNVSNISMSGKTVSFEWKNKRPSESYIISMTITNLGNDVDSMLINQADCKAPIDGNKMISVYGNRTSASDAAVETLQQKGYTVTVSPA